MIYTAIVLAIVCGAMFVATKAVDLLFNLLNFVSKKEGIQPGKSAQITERVLDSLQLQEYYSPHYASAASTCEIEPEALSEGLQVSAEFAVEHISTIVEGLSNS